jgi:F-type H+-transporting ATPase subunit b
VELSWTTFILEIINFLVLVWVLKRLFYAPIKRAIGERRAAIEKTLHDAESSKQEAQQLQSSYEGRLREWEVEKKHQKEEFQKELGEERTRQLKLTANLVAEEREKAQAQQQKIDAERRINQEREAMKQALEFTSRLLKDMSCPELEAKIVDLVTRQLTSAEKEIFPSPAAPSRDHKATVQVRSAYSLTEQQRVLLTTALRSKLGAETPVEFEVDGKLHAGLEIIAGSYVLRANLRDELQYFSAMRNHE